ncbi:MAG: 3-oxoacyl-ACP synthase [bacterium]|nr:3-oxoacyl-ACP synthase [bacterium]
MTPRVGLLDIGVFMPERWMSAAEISQASEIPEEVLIERFGLDGKHIAGPDDHVSTMAAAASIQALERAGVTADEVDVVMYFGSMGKDYYIWSAAPKIQDLIGARNAWSLEMSYVSCGAPVAIKVATDLLRADPDISTMVIAGACRESHFLDYTNQRSRFMFNFGDGGAAAVLRRGDEGHEILASKIITDGQFADDVAIYAGGSRTPTTHETVDAGMHFFDVGDPQSMKERLDPVSGVNFVKIALDTCAAAGVEIADIKLLAPIHFKRSFFDWIIAELGIPEERTAYLRRHGHMSGIDPLVGIDMRRDDLSPGDLVLCLSAGTGYTWAASVLRW